MNMKDIAAHLGISVATVSRAINGSENINLETKERILAFVEKKGYTPNVIARNLSKMENNTIALLVPNISNPFFASLINNICANFAKSDYPANSITASIEAPLLINRYRFVSCSCFSCFCKKA